jgi:beta-lactamase superfamily II metal-dependent hydrolase
MDELLDRLTAGAVLLALALAADAAPAPTPTPMPSVRWTMINVSSRDLQADAHLIRMPDGGYQMIDAGDSYDRVVPYLQKHGVKKIERVFLSHLHKDHYAGLAAILAAGIEVCDVFVNRPDPAVCAAEVPWGCDQAHLQETFALLKARGVPVVDVRRGQMLYDKDGVRMQVLYAYDGVHTPVGRTDVNDTSVITSLEYGKTRVLFTGDLNSALGTYLAAHATDLKADILKVPHHGTEGVAPNEFFDRVGATVALVPAPVRLWLSERSERVRWYLQNTRTQTFVSGIDGHVTVRIGPNGFKVMTTRVLKPAAGDARKRSDDAEVAP